MIGIAFVTITTVYLSIYFVYYINKYLISQSELDMSLKPGVLHATCFRTYIVEYGREPCYKVLLHDWWGEEGNMAVQWLNEFALVLPLSGTAHFGIYITAIMQSCTHGLREEEKEK